VVVKHVDLHCVEEVGLQLVTHDTENMLKHLEHWVTMAPQEFGIRCLGVGIAERSKWIVIPPGLLLVRRNIIFKSDVWTVAPESDMRPMML
jgi:hypothetical protein